MVLFWLTFTAAVPMIVVTYFMRRSKKRLELVSDLYSSLEAARAEAGPSGDGVVRMLPNAYEQIAQIERAQISRQRVESILHGTQEAGAGPYVLQKSRAAQRSQASLDASTRLRVQDQIDALASEPHPSGVTEDPKSRALCMRVPSTSVVVCFSVDDEARRIQILSMETTLDEPQSRSAPIG